MPDVCLWLYMKGYIRNSDQKQNSIISQQRPFTGVKCNWCRTPVLLSDWLEYFIPLIEGMTMNLTCTSFFSQNFPKSIGKLEIVWRLLKLLGSQPDSTESALLQQIERWRDWTRGEGGVEDDDRWHGGVAGFVERCQESESGQGRGGNLEIRRKRIVGGVRSQLIVVLLM